MDLGNRLNCPNRGLNVREVCLSNGRSIFRDSLTETFEIPRKSAEILGSGEYLEKSAACRKTVGDIDKGFCRSSRSGDSGRVHPGNGFAVFLHAVAKVGNVVAEPAKIFLSREELKSSATLFETVCHLDKGFCRSSGSGYGCGIYSGNGFAVFLHAVAEILEIAPEGTEILLAHKPLKGPSGGGKVIRYLGKSLGRVGGIYDDCSIKAGYAVGISLERRSEFFELVSELDDVVLAGYLLKKTAGRRNTCREL